MAPQKIPETYCAFFFLEALVNHPRDVIPPFTHAMMKKAWVRRCETAFDGVCLWSKAQERMEATLAEVKNAEDAITQLEVPEIPVAAWTFGILRMIVYLWSSGQGS